MLKLMERSSFSALIAVFLFTVGAVLSPSLLLGQTIAQNRLGDAWLETGYNDGYNQGWTFGSVDYEHPGSVDVSTINPQANARDDYDRGWYGGWKDGWLRGSMGGMYMSPDYNSSMFKWRISHGLLG